jgi:hypothetical protein
MRRFICTLGLAVLGASQPSLMAKPDPAHFIGLDQFGAFDRTELGGAVVLTSPWLYPPRAWNELVVSWNAAGTAGGGLSLEARASRGKAVTPFYILGRWSSETNQFPRTSVGGQKDQWAEVQTDTLVCRKLMERVQVRVTLRGAGALPRLKFLGICTCDTAASPESLAPQRSAWGKVIEAPRRSQLGHPGAAGWCSPATVSMILGYWAARLHRPELDVPVDAVARAVYDPGWAGTGNWVFNTAFAGQFDGMRAYVARLAGLPEIEAWVAAGLPVAASVSFDLLNGRPADEGNGHLIVVVGFTERGDVVANDPWPNPKQENSVRKVFPRANFLRAWQRSHRMVYLIHPLSVKPPTDPLGHWNGSDPPPIP